MKSIRGEIHYPKTTFEISGIIKKINNNNVGQDKPPVTFEILSPITKVVNSPRRKGNN